MLNTIDELQRENAELKASILPQSVQDTVNDSIEVAAEVEPAAQSADTAKANATQTDAAADLGQSSA